MRFGCDQNSELAESRCGGELTLVSVDLHLTEVVEDSFRRNSPYNICIESGAKAFRLGDAVDFNFDLSHVAVALQLAPAGRREHYFDVVRERNRDDIEIDRADCQH